MAVGARTTSPDRSSAGSTDPVPAAGSNVLFDVWLVMRATVGVLDQALAPSGLTADEFGVYSVLNSTDAMTPGELAHGCRPRRRPCRVR